MKRLQSSYKLFFFVLLGFLLACKKEPCLDIPKLDAQTATTLEWFVHDSIQNQLIQDENGISETMRVASLNYKYTDVEVEDDCGNTYGSINCSIQYTTSLSKFLFAVDVRGSSLEDAGYYLQIQVWNSLIGVSKTVSYNFVSEMSSGQNSNIEELVQFQTATKIYSGVLKIGFNEIFSPQDVKTIYYAKGYGIIKIVKANGNAFEVI